MDPFGQNLRIDRKAVKLDRSSPNLRRVKVDSIFFALRREQDFSKG